MNLDFPWDYKHITADTLVRSGPGILHSITINKVPTTAGVITIYDNTSEAGTAIIAAILLGLKTEAQNLATLFYDVKFSTGLYIGFDANIVAADITVTYK